MMKFPTLSLCLIATLARAELTDEQKKVPLEADTPDASLAKIVLLAGPVSNKPGQHEYFSGCAMLMKCLKQTPSVWPVMAAEGWPKNEAIFKGAKSVVIYMDGGPKCAVGVMNELYRVLAPGGWLLTATPSSDGRGAFQDPTHTSFWNPNSFWYYTRSEQARFIRGIACRFQAARLWQSFPTEWERIHDIPYVYADLVALKGQRQPGLVEI